MTDFIIRFLLCNVLISGIIVILLITKRIFKNLLLSQMQYHLWFLLLVLLIIPFIPIQLNRVSQFLTWTGNLRGNSFTNNRSVMGKALNSSNSMEAANWMNDFTLSVGSKTPSATGLILFGIWFLGIIVMSLLFIRAFLHLRTIKKSALPLQNVKVRRLYLQCLNETEIHTELPVCTTAFLNSPMMAGLFKPCIYLPIHLISNYNESEMRYILLHELQHYRHKDVLIGYFMNIAGIFYWFNPLVWYALKEMRTDREIACDTYVLKMLEEDAYKDYGNTLINYAEKMSLTSFPFSIGLSGSMRQMSRRIINIATYEKPTLAKRVKGIAVFLLITVLLLIPAPVLSIYSSESSHYQWNTSSEHISYMDDSSYFGEYTGSFVLYDLENDVWLVDNMDRATLRVSPDSTYKIYDALFGLEENIITPKHSLITWSGEIYPFDAWNANQNLTSAMTASVNWYFQEIDKQLGTASVNHYIKKIGYGNENINGNFSNYWLESSLKISPVEQVKLLVRLHNNSLDFAEQNMNAVKDAICLFSSDEGTFYGKTGTGRVDGSDVNGWFVGYIEATNHTYFFAANIAGKQNATGSKAAAITMSLLSDLNIWK